MTPLGATVPANDPDELELCSELARVVGRRNGARQANYRQAHLRERHRKVDSLIFELRAVELGHHRVEHHLLFAAGVDSHRPFLVLPVRVPHGERRKAGLMRDQVELEGIDYLHVGNLGVGDRDPRDAALKVDYLRGARHQRDSVGRHIMPAA